MEGEVSGATDCAGVLLMRQKATRPETLVLRIGDRRQIGVTATERWHLKEEHEGKSATCCISNISPESALNQQFPKLGSAKPPTPLSAPHPYQEICCLGILPICF